MGCNTVQAYGVHAADGFDCSTADPPSYLVHRRICKGLFVFQ